MDPAQQREIAAEGGRAAHQKGTAHEFTSEEAREAGRKGGEKTALSRSGGLRGPSTQSSRRVPEGRQDAGDELLGGTMHGTGGRSNASDSDPGARSANRDN
jgi:hypothetical protein